MGTEKISVKIKGTSPLLMHAFPLVAIDGFEKKEPREQCDLTSYRDPQTKRLCVPAVCVQRMLVNGASYCKGRGRASLQKVAAACIFVEPSYLELDNQEPEVDARPVVVPATRGRIVRYRYRFDHWAVSFDLEYDPTLLKASEVRKIVEESISRVGLLDFRPACKGMFGRSMIMSWK